MNNSTEKWHIKDGFIKILDTDQRPLYMPYWYPEYKKPKSIQKKPNLLEEYHNKNS